MRSRRFRFLWIVALGVAGGLLARAFERSTEAQSPPKARFPAGERSNAPGTDPDTGAPFTLDSARLAALGLDTEFHRCTQVADGDTLTLEGLGTVRLIGVDTPEKGHATRPVEFMASEAGRFTRDLCLGRRVRLEYDPWDEDCRDKYNRILGYAWLEDGALVQEKILRNGYAAAYTAYPFDPGKKRRFLAWEAEAKGSGLGIWKDRGLAEVRWLDAEGYPEYRVIGMNHKTWGIRIGDWVLPRIPPGELEDRLTELRQWIFEYSPGDLEKTLAEHGYVRER